MAGLSFLRSCRSKRETAKRAFTTRGTQYAVLAGGFALSLRLLMSTNLSALDYVILFVMLNLMFLLFTGSSAYALLKRRDRARFARLERKVDAILKHLGIDAHQFETLSDDVKKLADEGKKIPAIKLHREQ